MSAARLASTIDDTLKGRIKVLYVSPERLVSPSFRRLFQHRWDATTSSMVRAFPAVSLLCVDEAHCMSHWAHNFRPSYLRIGSLVDSINPRSVLALTATAGPPVIDDICQSLQIPRQLSDGDNSDDQQSSGLNILRADRDNIDVKACFVDDEDARMRMVSHDG